MVTAIPTVTHDSDILVIGLGYVGLTLAVGLAAAGQRVLGYDVDARRVELLAGGVPAFYEPGLAETTARLPPGRLRYTVELPGRLPATTVICVGTPVDLVSRAPQLHSLRAAAAGAGARAAEGDLVILRSTVPVGTTRGVVLPELAHLHRPLLAFCPERTIQGQALRELRELPQVVGGIDAASCHAAMAALAPLCPRQVPVSSLETAEFVKLINNAHTDTLYGFGNEVALLAEQLCLDGIEAVSAANVDYPRPDIAGPGFVGGGCLTKDPYLLLASISADGDLPLIVPAARRLNEHLPDHLAERLLRVLKDSVGIPSPPRVLVCGLAYKGRPPTDDVRGSPAPPVIARLRDQGAEVVAHDYMVPRQAAVDVGVPMVDLEEGFTGADAAVFLTDHPGYRSFDIRSAVATMRRPAVVLDGWGVVEAGMSGRAGGVTYLRLGRG